MEVVVTTAAIRCAKLESNHHHQQTNTQLLQSGCPSSQSTNSVKALKGITLETSSVHNLLYNKCRWQISLS